MNVQGMNVQSTRKPIAGRGVPPGARRARGRLSSSAIRARTFPPIVEGFSRARGTNAKLPRPVLVPHENLAVAMAHGAYAMTGRPQAVMVHVNVGTGNTINNLVNLSRDRVPLILAAGRTPITEKGSFGSRSRQIHWGQEMFDQAGMVRELVKWDYELRTPGQVADVVARAHEVTMTSPRGPVYLVLPREPLCRGRRRRGRTGRSLPRPAAARRAPPPASAPLPAPWRPGRRRRPPAPGRALWWFRSNASVSSTPLLSAAIVSQVRARRRRPSSARRGMGALHSRGRLRYPVSMAVPSPTGGPAQPQRGIACGGRSLYGAPLGILVLEARFPRIPGDIGNAATWPFPVL